MGESLTLTAPPRGHQLDPAFVLLLSTLAHSGVDHQLSIGSRDSSCWDLDPSCPPVYTLELELDAVARVTAVTDGPVDDEGAGSAVAGCAASSCARLCLFRP